MTAYNKHHKREKKYELKQQQLWNEFEHSNIAYSIPFNLVFSHFRSLDLSLYIYIIPFFQHSLPAQNFSSMKNQPY